ncbi:MAG TPA: hypothetical protein VFG69_10560 [Nannocystaceae bacterium]|nr:hypothetical protein [Nannocystaceae bacterium]
MPCCLRASSIAAFLAVGCAGDDGPPASGETGGSTSDGSTSADPSDDGSSSAAPETSGDASSTDAVDSSGTGGLPDYSDSPCWGMPASTDVYDGQTHQVNSVAATCRAEGERTLVMVADALWENGIDQAAVNGFMHRFELFTPDGSWDPEQGVIVNDEAIFGSLDAAALPNGKLAVFVVDSNGGGDGYLCSWCDYPQVHLDGIVLAPLDDDLALSIAAHETYHVIHRGYDADEEVWVDESIAEAAMTANGFFTDDEWLDEFRLDPDVAWGPSGVDFGTFDYGAGLLWGTFLWEKGGPELMAAITAEPANGWEGLDAALASVAIDDDAWSLFLEMGVAMVLDRPDLGYGFTAFDVGEVAREGDVGLGEMVGGNVSPYGIDVWRIVADGTASVSVTPDAAVEVSARAFAATDPVVVVDPIAAAADLELAAGEGFVVVTAPAATSYTITVQ